MQQHSDNSKEHRAGRVLVKKLLLLARWGIALGLLYFISRQFSFEDLRQVLSRSQPLWLIIAVFAQLASTLVAALRWYFLMRQSGYPERLWFYQASYLKAVLFNQGLPTSIGGDALRIIDLVKLGHTKGNSFAAVLTDRIFGVSGLLVLALFANNALVHGFTDRFVLIVNMICGGALLTIVAIALAGVLPIIRSLPVQRIGVFAPLWIVSRYVRQTMLSISGLSTQCGLALITHILTVVTFIAIGKALSIDLSWQAYMAFVPPLMLFAFVPLSLAGWGIRETGAVALLGLVGVAQAGAFAMSVTFGLVLIATAAPGLVIYLRGDTSSITQK